MDLSTQIIIGSLTIILGFFGSFLGSYFNQKGKNLADKEDVKKLTKEVETVKQQLTVNTHRSNTIFIEQKEALILFYSSFFKWYTNLIKPYNFDTSNYYQIPSLLKEEIKNLNEYKMNKARLELFINDEEVQKKAEKHFNNCDAYHYAWSIVYETLSRDLPQLDDSNRNVSGSQNFSEKSFHEGRVSNLEKLIEMNLRRFSDNWLNFYNEIEISRKDFVDTAKTYITDSYFHE